jgi:hypothetical protein
MDVIVPLKKNGRWVACLKPGGQRCPNVRYDEGTATCAVHDEAIYQGSPCWRYGNSEVDPDFWNKRGKPCPVGEAVKRVGGVPEVDLSAYQEVGVEDLHELGPWPTDKLHLQVVEEAEN